jgi:ribosome-binding protein aMBF1 (putative translation factor)
MAFSRRPNPVFSEEYRCLVEVLVCARRQAGLSQRALARAMGKSQSHVSKIELGERRVDALEFHHMAEACGVEPAELYGRVAARLAAMRRPTPFAAVGRGGAEAHR